MDLILRAILENQIVIMRELINQTGDPDTREELHERVRFTEAIINLKG